MPHPIILPTLTRYPPAICASHETLPMIAIRRGSGAWLEDFEGKRYLDAVSSWWVMPPYIVDEAEMDLMVRVAADAIELATCD